MFQLPDLPYAADALKPHISADTMNTHHGKHHRKYVDTLNKLIENTDLAEMTLEQIIAATSGGKNASEKKIFNNAAQSWNHEFFWSSLVPNGGGEPTGELKRRIEKDFGDYASFADEFLTLGGEHFGSGWVWLVASDDALEVITTHDADLPLAHGKQAILTCDLWEHAYYLDYKNERPKFLKAFLDELANWEFAEANLAVAHKPLFAEIAD